MRLKRWDELDLDEFGNAAQNNKTIYSSNKSLLSHGSYKLYYIHECLVISKCFKLP